MKTARRGSGGAGCSLLIFALLVGVVGWRWSGRPVRTETDSAPIVIMPTPLQVDIPKAQRTPLPLPVVIEESQLTVETRAKYRVAAMVVGRKRYRDGWKGELVPYDLGLAWGDLTLPEVFEHVRFWQTRRWLFYSWDSDLPRPNAAGFVIQHASNHHMMPATENIRRALSRLSEGDLIEAEGYLVAIGGTRRGHPVGWASSMTRNDTSDGACELMYVESLKVGDAVYR